MTVLGQHDPLLFIIFILCFVLVLSIILSGNKKHIVACRLLITV